MFGVIGKVRTVGYAEHGANGILTLLIHGVLCNRMVPTGVVAAFLSTQVSGKVIAIWMPNILLYNFGEAV